MNRIGFHISQKARHMVGIQKSEKSSWLIFLESFIQKNSTVNDPGTLIVVSSNSNLAGIIFFIDIKHSQAAAERIRKYSK